MFTPYIGVKVGVLHMTIKEVTDYITNYLCFIALSVEVFIILYANEIMKHVTVILFLDTLVLIGLLAMAVYRAKGKRSNI